MIALLLLTVPSPVVDAVPHNAPAFVLEDPKEQYKKKREEAGKDVDALWELYEWCEAFGLSKEGRSCLRAILKVDKEHVKAHEGLGHILYDGKWFTNQKKLDAYKKKEELRRAEEEGLVKYEGEWVPKDDVPFLKKGLVRDENGNWVNEQERRRVAEGWKKQDLVWVSPEEQENVDKGLWKCGDQWLSLEEANKYHAELDTWWAIPTDYFIVYSTCPRDITMEAVDHMDRAFRELSRIYGRSPADPVPVVLMNSQAQYSSLAAGPGGNQQATESHGLSSVHYAYFADLLFREDDDGVRWIRSGVGYWDSKADSGALWGKHSARHAAAQSYAEALDPSQSVVDSFESNGNLTDRDFSSFYKEKKVPQWFRIGAVTYAERYFVDSLVKAGGNPYWAREWSIQNILNKGGLQSLDEIFDGELAASDPTGSAKIMNQLGLVMAFILDGDVAELKEAHAAVKAALKEGKDASKQFKALAKLVENHEEEFRKFAGV